MKQGNAAMLAVLYVAGFIAAFNENIINVVLIDIMEAFDVSSLTANWLVTGYMIVTAIVVALMAHLISNFGPRKLLLFGTVFLLGGSIGCFFAPNFALLLIFRLMQSVGTGIFITLMMTCVLSLAPKEKIGAFLAIGSCCITLGPALAPVVSGAMASAFGWRWVFVVPAAVILLVGIAGVFFVRSLEDARRRAVDATSVALAVIGLFGLVYGFTELATDMLPALVTLAIGIACVALFIRRQFKIENHLIDVAPLRNRRFIVACLFSVIAMITTFSMSVILMLYFEGALGIGAFESGALLLVPILANSITAIAAGKIMDSRGPWPLLPAGFAVIAVGQAAVALFSARMSLFLVVCGAVLTYAGVGLIMSPSQTAGLKAIEKEQHASGVSLINLCIQLAACIGPALLVGLLSSVSGDLVQAGMGAEFAQAQGFSAAVWFSCAIAAVGAALAVPFARSYKGDSRSSTPSVLQPAEKGMQSNI